MARVTFFHHERLDGGTRTGVTVDGFRAVERYVPGGEEADPTLLWFVDVMWDAPAGFGTQEDAEEWLTARADALRGLLAEAADRLRVGVDLDDVPWEFTTDTADGPVRVAVAVLRRGAWHDIAARLRRLLATDVPALLGSFEAVPAGG